MNKKIYILIIMLILIFSCPDYERTIKPKKIFKFNIGYKDNEIGIFSDINGINNEIINIYYSNGFYFISDFKNKKIIKTTESGIVNLIIFNPEFNSHLNPTDNELSNSQSSENTSDENVSQVEEETVYLKSYIDYSELYPGMITADVEKNIYVENIHPSYKKFNNDGNVLDSLILKFDKKGHFLFKIGREGINSIPFGKIYNIITDNNNNLIVIEKLFEEFNIYKFNPSGKLLIQSKISKNDIPLNDKERDYIFDIVSIIPSYSENDIFITCQYIKESMENLKIKSFETAYEKVIKYSLNNNKMKLMIKMNPEYIDISKNKNYENLKQYFGNNKKILKPLETLTGIDAHNKMYFIQKEFVLNKMNENRYRILIYDKNANLKNNILVDFPEDIRFISNFYLSTEGKIYFYYIIHGEIQFVVI